MRWKLERTFAQPNGEVELPMDAVPVTVRFLNNIGDEKAVYYLTKVRPTVADKPITEAKKP